MRKSRWVIVATVFLVVAAVAVTIYIRQYYLPMRDAKPILKMLERGTLADLDAAARSLYNRPRLREPGASRVRQTVLRELANTTDEDRFFHLVRIIGAGTETRQLIFNVEDHMGIIKAAVERCNARPEKVRTYTIATDTNGIIWLSCQLPPIP